MSSLDTFGELNDVQLEFTRRCRCQPKFHPC